MFQEERAVAAANSNGSEGLKTTNSDEPSGHDYKAEASGVQSQITLDAFLAVFYPTDHEGICLRAFKAKNAPDAPYNRAVKLRITRARLAADNQLRHYLKSINSTRGLYFVVNAGGDNDASITRFNACFVERDDVMIEEQHQAFDLAPLPPSIRVETRKSVHGYWPLAAGCDARKWVEIQLRLIAFFHGDKANKNPSRVMRLPYFGHISYNETTGELEHKRVELSAFNGARRYTAEELLTAYPPTVDQSQPPINESKEYQACIPEGERNVKLTSLAGKLRQLGFDEEGLVVALSDYDRKHCKPPLGPDEVRSIARSVSRYESGAIGSFAEPEPKSEMRPQYGSGPLSIVRMADVEPETVSWLWHPYIARGKFTIIEGDPGLGKSWLTCALACAVSHGRGFPEAEPFEPGNVLMLSAEDGLGDTLRPRLNAVGAEVTRVFALNELITFSTSGLFRLEAAIIEHKPLLVIIDPLFAFTGGKMDINRANESRAISAPLAAIAERHGCAMVAVRHLGKSRGGGHALNAGIGSIDFTAAARSVLLVGRDPDDEKKRAIVQTKNNLAPLGVAIGFKVEGDKFRWTGASDLTAARMLLVASSDEERGNIGEAAEFLHEILSDGPQPASAVKAAARHAGVSEATLRRARNRLGIRPIKRGQPSTERQCWVWELPAEDAQLHSEDVQTLTSEHLRANELTKDSYINDLAEGAQSSPSEHLQTDEESEAEAIRDYNYRPD